MYRRTVPRRRNGTRSVLVDHLVCKCGIDEKTAERMAPKSEAQVSTRHALSPSDLRLYQKTVRRVVKEPAVQAILLLLPLTGFRVSEACGIRMEAVEARGRRNRLSATVVGKGAKVRTVPLGRAGTRLVLDYVNRVRPDSDSPYVFTGPKGGKVTPSMVQAACRDVADATGLAVTPHVLRHTYASLAVAKCWDLHRLQAVLGHGKAGSKRLPAVTLLYLDDNVVEGA